MPPEPLPDRDEARRLAERARARRLRWALPALFLALFLGAWQGVVTAYAIPHYILPGPGLVARTLLSDIAILAPAWGFTLAITLMALALAVLVGGGLALVFARSKWLEMALFPYAVLLQVTPVVAVAPLIFIYVQSKLAGVLICAWLVAFFPVLSNTALGLSSAVHNLRDLFTIHRASRWQRLWLLELPSALPYFLGGLRIAGGLSLIGAVVAEFVAGSGGIGSGLAFRIYESSFRLMIPRMFAALVLIIVTGVAIHLALSLLSHLLLRRWHESAVARER